MAEYEWLTKAKRPCFIGCEVKQRVVYPPRAGEVYPTLNWHGRRIPAVPQDGGIYVSQASSHPFTHERG